MTLSVRLLLLLGLSLFLSFFRWGRVILFPFQIFTTWVHECWHALVALLLGGSAIHITLSTDGSGLTVYKIGSGRMRRGIISSAGYLGASATGCALFYFTYTAGGSSHSWNVHTLALTLVGLIGLSILFWIRNFFGLLSTLILGTGLAALYYPPMNHYAKSILFFLSIQTALNALFDLRTLLSLGSAKANASDAHTMQKLFFLPYWIWALAWLSMSVWMMYWTLKRLGLNPVAFISGFQLPL